MKIFEYVRCPCCGKLSRARNFHSSINHNLEIKVNEIGGKGHIKWFSKDISPDVLYMLYIRFKNICTRLERLLGLSDMIVRPILKSRIRSKVRPGVVYIDGKKFG
jgi:hypothetical protein